MSDAEAMRLLLHQQTQLMAAMQEQISLIQQQMAAMNNDAKSNVKSSVSVPWPQPLEVDTGDPFENLEFFRNRWENYCIATGMNKWGPDKSEVKAGLLLNAIGNAAMKKFMDFGLTEDDKKSEESIFKKIEDEIIKKTNIIYSRYIFNMRNQLPEEVFDDYLLTLTKLMKPCNYPDNIKDELLRDRIVVGIKESKVITELLRKEDLMLESAINICRAAEQASAQVADLQREESVNKVSKAEASVPRNQKQPK